MAYEEMDYEVILGRMIETVEEINSDLDTREGSVIYNALAPAALEISMLYSELDNVLNESFVDTASREYLLLKCKELNIDESIFEATYGVHKGEFDVEVPIGSRWNCDIHNYIVTDYIGVVDDYFTYRLKCETPGIEPNLIVGDLTPIDDTITDLSYAVLVDCIIEGEDEATDEFIRERYYNEIKNTARDGNKAQYEYWCETYPGIGNYIVSGDKNGVTVSITSSSNGVASDELVTEFQNYLDPGSTGMGDGVAPIGAVVTVVTGTEKAFNFSANVILENGYTDTSIVTDAVAEYLQSMVFKEDSIYLLKLASYILNKEGVANISNLKINGSATDASISVGEIPIVGTTNWTVGW